MAGAIRGRALIVGVAAYQHVGALPGAVRNDVFDIAALLTAPDTGGYAADAVTLLVDGAATAPAIAAALDDAARALSEQDPFLFYFSGHGHRVRGAGGDHSYLLGADSRLDDLENTAVADGELLRLLRALPSRRQVIMLDSCHAGGIGTLKEPDDVAAPLGVSEKSVARLAEGRGRVVLASSRDDERSLILAGARNSLFTEAILRGLRGGAADRGDGMVGILDLFSFVAAEVPMQAPQHPVLKADGLEQNFPIAVRPSAAGIKRAGSGTLAKPGLVDLFASLYPLGPTQGEFWSRAGGDVSRLSLAGHGLAQWHAALRLVEKGGGGIDARALIEAAFLDFPGNPQLQAWLSA